MEKCKALEKCDISSTFPKRLNVIIVVLQCFLKVYVLSKKKVRTETTILMVFTQTFSFITNGAYTVL